MWTMTRLGAGEKVSNSVVVLLAAAIVPYIGGQSTVPRLRRD